MSFVFSCSKLQKSKDHQRDLADLKKHPEKVWAAEFEAKKKYYEMKKSCRTHTDSLSELVT